MFLKCIDTPHFRGVSKGVQMDILELFIEYFGIDMLTGTSTIVDLINLVLEIGIGIYLVSFTLRSLFYLLKRY